MAVKNLTDLALVNFVHRIIIKPWEDFPIFLHFE